MVLCSWEGGGGGFQRLWHAVITHLMFVVATSQEKVDVYEIIFFPLTYNTDLMFNRCQQKTTSIWKWNPELEFDVWSESSPETDDVCSALQCEGKGKLNMDLICLKSIYNVTVHSFSPCSNLYFCIWEHVCFHKRLYSHALLRYVHDWSHMCVCVCTLKHRQTSTVSLCVYKLTSWLELQESRGNIRTKRLHFTQQIPRECSCKNGISSQGILHGNASACDDTHSSKRISELLSVQPSSHLLKRFWDQTITNQNLKHTLLGIYLSENGVKSLRKATLKL